MRELDICQLRCKPDVYKIATEELIIKKEMRLMSAGVRNYKINYRMTG